MSPVPTSSFVPQLPPIPAPRTATRRTGVRTTSVPAILLSLGALCLLVAAVIFLAVAWSWLGVGGRTGVLAGLTVTGAGLGGWLTSRGLRVAGEALSTVTFGLLSLDLVGADRAGWLGERTSSELALLLGLSLLGTALAWSVAQTRLAAPQVVAGLGLFTVYAATVDLVGHQLFISAVAVVAFAALAGVGRVNGLTLLPWVALAGAAPCWLTLAGSGLGEALERPALSTLWAVGGPGWALLAATALLLLPIAARRDDAVALACLTAAASMAVGTVCVPVADEGVNTVVLTALAVIGCGRRRGRRCDLSQLAGRPTGARRARVPAGAGHLADDARPGHRPGGRRGRSVHGARRRPAGAGK